MIAKGSFLKYRNDPCGYSYELFKQYGPIYSISLGLKKNVYFFHTEEAVKKVLVTHGNHFNRGIALENAKSLIGESILTSDGQEHLKIRKLLSKIYSKTYVLLFEKEIKKYINMTFSQELESEVELNSFFSSISLDIISILLFGVPSREQTELVNEVIKNAFELISRMYIPGYRLLMKTPFSKKTPFKKSINHLRELLDELIQNRETSNKKYQGTIDLLIDNGLSSEEIMSQVLALFLAGHETTSTTLTWLVYGVLKNDFDSSTFYKECSKAYKSSSSYEDLDQYPHIKSVIFETFRFYPPIWSIGRKVVKEIEINNINLKENDYVGLCPYVMHRNPIFYSEPELYKPTRWITSHGFHRPQSHEFFPFSLGMRNCIGKFLAETEVFNIIIQLFSKFKLELITKEQIKAKAYIALKPDQDIKVRFNRI